MLSMKRRSAVLGFLVVGLAFFVSSVNLANASGEAPDVLIQKISNILTLLNSMVMVSHTPVSIN